MYQMQPDVLQSGVVQRSVSPYTVNKDDLQGPRWANSLFEDNA